jgi:hypothetical protein
MGLPVDPLDLVIFPFPAVYLGRAVCGYKMLRAKTYPSDMEAQSQSTHITHTYPAPLSTSFNCVIQSVAYKPIYPDVERGEVCLDIF